MAKKIRKTVFSGIGGQAVLEGIMMKNKNEYSVAVRKPDGNIEVKKCEDTSFSATHKWTRLPLIRGVFSFVDSMVLGMKTLSYSASFIEDDEPETGKESFVEKIFGAKAESVVMGITVFISLIIAIALFMMLPYFVSEWIGSFIQNDSMVAIIEGILRIVIFFLYVVCISVMKDIRRLYQYHGAEHKCINCIEAGRPLTVKNVMASSRLHRRCGTSFLLFVVVISVILFFFIRVDQVWLKALLRLALVPVIASISYEILRFAGRSDGLIIRILSIPGMLLQKLTTREPDEEMVEVAIAAVEAVFDWEKFEKKNFKSKTVKKTVKDSDGKMVEIMDETIEISLNDIEDKLQENMKS